MTIKFPYKQIDNSIIIENIDIDLKNTLFSGQAFRWKEHGKGFIGVCFEKVIYTYKQDDNLIIENIDLDFFENTIAHYFDLYKDYNQILANFESDEYFLKSREYAPGIRVLNQQPFETLISFIISANNNIKRIRLIIDRICTKCGSKIIYNNEYYYTFPSPKQLKTLSEQDLKDLGCGYRASYIFETCKAINNGFDLQDIKSLPYLTARKNLCKLKGVGNKVADCILLYSLGFTNAFPMDVWIKRVIHSLYGFESTKDSDILEFVDKKFGKYAGIAQQYLFYYVKENKIGIN